MNKMTLNTLAAMAFATMLSAPAFGQNSVDDRDQNLINMTSKGWEW